MNMVALHLVVLRSAEERSIEAGGDHPQDSDYRENNDFFYLTGIESPESYLVLVANDTTPDLAVLYIPPRNPQSEQWTSVIPVSALTESPGPSFTPVHCSDPGLRGGTKRIASSAAVSRATRTSQEPGSSIPVR